MEICEFGLESENIFEDYYDCIETFIDCITTNCGKTISFDDLYRNNYTLTIAKHHDIINSAYELIRWEIAYMPKEKRVNALRMLNDIFAYPIRMKVIEQYNCVSCDGETFYYDVYCKKHKQHFKLLDEIEKFEEFKNEAIYGGYLSIRVLGEEN